MIRITSTEFGKEVGRYQDAALSQPVVVTRNGRDRTVTISVEEYRQCANF
jgi:PHD/YefM family antitoxin component YafN of YafNO toxin-antitoxin module